MELQSIQSSGGFAPQTGMKPASEESAQSTKAQSSSASSIQKQADDMKKNTDQKDLKQELMQLTENLNKEMNPLNINVKFGFEDKIGEMSVSVYEKDSNKLIRKFPSDEAVALMTKMREIIGIIFDKKA
jgi:flagellar protein FlaG